MEIDEVPKDDINYRLQYQKGLLTFNLLLRSINDAIKEGDGERLFEFFRVALLYFKCYYGRTKYAYSVIKSLFRIQMEPSAAFFLIWERFINTRGMRGCNISQDLHLEHLNNFLKELLRDLRGNLDIPNADRVSKSVNNLNTIVENFERKMEIKKGLSSRNKAKIVDDVRNLSAKFLEDNIFAEEPTKASSYDSFPKFNEQTLASLDIDNLLKWAKEKKAEFKRIYN